MGRFSVNSLQLFTPIAAAVISSAATLFIALFITRKRKHVTFLVSQSEDLTLALRDHGFVSLKVGNFDISKLNRARIFVKNAGNEVINNFCFDITMPGHHPMHLAEKKALQNKLNQAITITWDDPPAASGPVFHIGVTQFFNPKEFFEIIVFFEGDTVRCEVECRVEGVACKIHRTESVTEDPLNDLMDDMRNVGIQRFLH